jgi:hypothetical protein
VKDRPSKFQSRIPKSPFTVAAERIEQAIVQGLELTPAETVMALQLFDAGVERHARLRGVGYWPEDLSGVLH